MTTIREVFAQQVDVQENAWENILEVSGVIEAAGIETFTIQQRNTIFLAVKDHHFKTAFDIVYYYWHLGQAISQDPE